MGPEKASHVSGVASASSAKARTLISTAAPFLYPRGQYLGNRPPQLIWFELAGLVGVQLVEEWSDTLPCHALDQSFASLLERLAAFAGCCRLCTRRFVRALIGFLSRSRRLLA